MVRSYTAGEWFGVFGDRATVLLPPSEKGRVAALWEQLDEGAGFDEALDTLIAAGLRDLPGFVLVSDDDGAVKVVIRGEATATFTTGEGEVVVAGSEATTWVEKSLTAVTAMTLVVGESSDEIHTITGGLVRVARVSQPAESAPVEETAPVEEPPTEDSAPVAETTAEPEPVPAVVPEPEPEPETAPYAAAPPAPAAEEPVVADDDAIAPVEAAPPVAAPAVPPATWGTPGPAAPAQGADVPTPSEPPAEQPAEQPQGGDDTRSGGWQPDEFARPPAGIAGQPQPPAVTAAPVARLVFSSGESVDVDRSVLVGRAPEARHFAAGEEEPRLVTVPSPNQEISSTHLEIRPGAGADHGSAVVTDLGSTNGTVLAQPGLPAEDLQPGIAVQLIPGAIVDLGEGVTIQVTNA
ncbi:MAG: FHA domain-containing protein [Nocardioides sp.]